MKFNKYQCGIYQILNIKNSRRYIGSTMDFRARFNTHKSHLKSNRHGNSYLQNAWNKYGEDAFEFTKILICEPKDLIMYEQIFMDYYRSLDLVYNVRMNAENNIGIAPANKGVPLSEERKEHLRKINLGKKHTEESKVKMSIASTGRYHTEEAKKKISETKRKNPMSLEARQALSNKGKSQTISIETREQISKKLTGNKLSQESINKRTETRRINREKAIAEGKTYGMNTWSEEQREKTKKTKESNKEKKRILNESIMFEAQSKLQNALFNV